MRKSQTLMLILSVVSTLFLLCGCGRPYHLSLYNKYYTPAMSEKEVKALKSSGNYPKEVVVKAGLNIAQKQALSNALINFYGCAYIGGSGFSGTDDWIYYGFWEHRFKTDDRKDPERLAQKVGANYYITYSEYIERKHTTTTNVDTKVATQGGMGRGITGGSTTTTGSGGILARGALFYLCD